MIKKIEVTEREYTVVKHMKLHNEVRTTENLMFKFQKVKNKLQRKTVCWQYY